MAVKGTAAFLACLLLYSAGAYSGDEDSDPAYLIYIDPETHKYTTDDPGAATRPEATVSTQASDTNSSALLVSASVVAILIAIVLVKRRRKSTA